jgi:diguanylate cyclase
MSLEGVIGARSLADAVIATLQRYDIPATPDNYALWYEYHAGHTPDLRRTIDVLVSNNAGFDESILHDLYAAFFSSVKEEQAVRETSLRVQETLKDMIAVADRARTDADQFGLTLSGVTAADFGKNIVNLKELIGHLIGETQAMAGRSHHVGARMRESTDKIEALERNLACAIREATVDGLTGLANRKSFDATIRKLAGEAMNSGDDLALLIIDIDHFKTVNDTWGHQVGDVVLCHLATTLRQSVRGEDHVARYGGEEFAIILPNTDANSAIAVGDNLRQALSRAPVRLELTPQMDPITISIGASCYEPGDPLAEWVGRTDAALYRAKREGRNRVQFAEGVLDAA